MTVFDMESKRSCLLLASLIAITCWSVAANLGFTKQNTFDYLRDINNLTGLEAFWMMFGQQLCAIVAFTFLEIREDIILLPEENVRRGVETEWPRSRVYYTIYFQFPIYWASTFAAFMYFKGPSSIFSDYSHESWATWGVKMVLWVIVWEFMMYTAHRVFHSVPWLYAIAHKGHHVVMDFPLGPHAPALEKLSHYVASIIASKIVGVSVGSWVLALNVLMTQCVLEHAYSSIYIPIWHDLFAFNTADLHQMHHVKNHVNFGYAFNIFDPLFGTLCNSKNSKIPSSVSGPATPARIRLLLSGRYKRALSSVCTVLESSTEQRESEKEQISLVSTCVPLILKKLGGESTVPPSVTISKPLLLKRKRISAAAA